MGQLDTACRDGGFEGFQLSKRIGVEDVHNLSVASGEFSPVHVGVVDWNSETTAETGELLDARDGLVEERKRVVRRFEVAWLAFTLSVCSRGERSSPSSNLAFASERGFRVSFLLVLLSDARLPSGHRRRIEGGGENGASIRGSGFGADDAVDGGGVGAAHDLRGCDVRFTFFNIVFSRQRPDCLGSWSQWWFGGTGGLRWC